MAGVPVAVVVEAAGVFQYAVEFDASGAHEVNIGLGGGVAVVEGSFFLRLTPEDFVIPIGIERRVDVDEVNAPVGEFFELVEVVAAVDDAGVEDGGGFFTLRRGGRTLLLLHRRPFVNEILTI